MSASHQRLVEELNRKGIHPDTTYKSAPAAGAIGFCCPFCLFVLQGGAP